MDSIKSINPNTEKSVSSKANNARRSLQESADFQMVWNCFHRTLHSRTFHQRQMGSQTIGQKLEVAAMRIPSSPQDAGGTRIDIQDNSARARSGNLGTFRCESKGECYATFIERIRCHCRSQHRRPPRRNSAPISAVLSLHGSVPRISGQSKRDFNKECTGSIQNRCCTE